MSRAEELQAALSDLNAEMVAKLGLEPGDDWTDFDRWKRETRAWITYDRLIQALEFDQSGTRPLSPS